MKKKFFSFLEALCFSGASLSCYGFVQENQVVTLNNKNSPLSLERAMDLSEKHSFSFRISEQDTSIADSQFDSAYRSMLPTVSLSGSYIKNSDSVNKLVGTTLGAQYGFPSITSAVASATLTQPLVGLYSMFLSLRAASAQAKAAFKSKELSRENARFYGASSFINAQKAIQLLKTAQSSQKLAEKLLDDAEAQYQAGKLTNADLLKFKLNFENAKTSFIQAQTTYKVTILTLAEAIGEPDVQNIQLPTFEGSVFESKNVKIPELELVYEEAFAKRFDIAAAGENVKAANLNKRKVISSYLPTVNFVATYSRNFESKDFIANGVNYKKADIQDQFFYGVQFSWVAVDWGVRQAQISQAVAQEQQAKLSLENLNSQARVDITNNYLQLKDAQQVLDSAIVSVQYAKDSYSQMKARFDNGQITASDLIASANDNISAQANLANSRGGLDLAWMAFQKSVGKRISTEN